MMHAYDALYLEKARVSLARMLDTAVNVLNMGIDEFFELFIVSGVADLFGSGDVRTLAGMSGVELAYEVLDICGISCERKFPEFVRDRSEEYWTGWALAYYQWDTSLSFAEIRDRVRVSDIRDMYVPYHEMDIRQFEDQMNRLIGGSGKETNLKIFREKHGISQSRLAKETGIPVRTIQQYEQRQKSINRAHVEYVIRLSKVLGCEPSELLEIE